MAKATKLPMFMRRRNILQAPTLAEVVKGCDTYVQNKILKGNMINGYVYPCYINQIKAKPIL
jgi:ATP-dependent helicase IRC3